MADHSFLENIGSTISAITGFSLLGTILFRRQNARIKTVEEDMKGMLPRTESDLLAEKIVSDIKFFLSDFYRTKEEVREDIGHAQDMLNLTIMPIKNDVNEMKDKINEMYIELQKQKNSDQG